MSHEYYGSPVDIPDFTDIVLNESWQQDKYFAQRRLAGICPFLLRKVTFDAGKAMSRQQLSLKLEYH